MEPSTANAIRGALFGALIGDALSMPTHWMYGGQRQVASTYGGALTGFVKPVERLPGSIMSKSATGGGGRGSYKGDVIGSIIFHGKKRFWAPGEDFHYHHALGAGENTLEGLLLRRTTDVLARHGFSSDALLDDYVKFMTTEDTHNDTYCGTCHRMFFARFAAGRPLADCPDNDGHNVDTIDALVTTIPVALFASSDDAAKDDVRRMVRLTRRSKPAPTFAAEFSTALRAVVAGGDLRGAIAALGTKFRLDIPSAVARLRARDPDQLTACYLDSAFPAMLTLAYRYADGDRSAAFRAALLANANRGGENVASGALLGALFGAHCGYDALPADLLAGLAPSDRDAINAEVDAFVAAVTGGDAGGAAL